MDWPIPSEAMVREPTPDTGENNARPFLASRAEPAEPLSILITENEERRGPSKAGPVRPVGRAYVLCAAALGVLAVGSAVWFEHRGIPSSSITEQLPIAKAPSPINLPPPNLLKPVTAEQATEQNAERPFVDRPDSPAAKFVLHTDQGDRDRALNCLTQAVYYEAASEGADGQRAVAQVVLNRLHHPGYPATVCGVVYQGAERSTGCQFTFVCDGSLQRAPAQALWNRSRKIAEEALAGHVFAPVGHATHYHADYVLPYWADVLDKTVQIGRHIFYRLRGPLGDPRGFSQRYGGTEPSLPVPQPAAPVPANTIVVDQAAAALIGAAAAAPQPVEKASSPVSAVAADATEGSLLIDGGKPVTPQTPHKVKVPSDCETGGTSGRVTALGAVDMRSGLSASSC